MKLAEKTVEVTSNIEYDESVAVGITDDPQALALIIERLISAYDNPYRAALREYTSNAYDEHIEAGVTDPVEVSLPDSLSPVLKVQDFGRGLTREELKGFGTIGKSTKQGSNETTGGFGMGSKVGLAASPQFTVVSVKNGKRNTVIVARDEQNVPYMNFLAETDTTDHSGTTIIVPISNRDKFGDLEDFWVGWKPGTIVVDGAAPRRSVYNPDQFLTLRNGLVYNDKSNIAASRDMVRLLINQVYYTLEYQKLGLSYQEQQILKYNIIRIDNGSVDINASREGLIVNARTRKALEERFKLVLGLASEARRAAVPQAGTLKEALVSMERMSRDGYPVTGLKWDGVSLVLPGSVISGNQVPNPFGTWVAAKQDHKSKSGYRADKDWYTMSRREPWRSDAKFVLVHSAGPATIYGRHGNRRAHREAHGVGDWMSVQSNAPTTRHETWQFFIVSEPLERLNRVYRELADVIVSAEDFNVVVSKVRAARAKDSKLAAKDKQLNQKLRVLHSTYYGRPDIVEMTAGDLKTQFDYVIFLRNQGGGLAQTVRDSYMTQANHNGSINANVNTLVRKYKAALVLINKNDDTTDLHPYLPYVTTLDDLVLRYVTENLVVPTDAQLIAARDYNKDGVRRIRALNEKLLSKIKRKETAEWIKALSEYKGAPSGAEDVNHLRYSVPAAEAALRKHQEAIAARVLPKSPYSRYPLLDALNYSAREDDVVQYINAMDKVSKKA